VSFAEALVREQPWRAELLGGDALSFARVVTFITDSVHIVFFQCTFTVKCSASCQWSFLLLGATGRGLPGPTSGLPGTTSPSRTTICIFYRRG